jgi:hypothetical protein
MIEIQLGGYKFRGICRIIPELNENGNPITYMPQSEYNNVRNLPLNEHGKGPFCRFHIPNGIDEAGVYAVLINNRLKYVGKCYSLSLRWNAGYGNISPRNCFVGGQSTNCRLNNLILNTFRAKSNIDLYFYKTHNFSEIEDNLIEQLNPEWNIQKSRRQSVPKLSTRKSRNKYQLLKDYLQQSEKSTERLTYDDMEEILGFKLPNSAYQYRPWWANSGQSHSETWTGVGWRVTTVNLGKYVMFGRGEGKSA